ncbi:MAG: hypothetical protein WA191_19580 [Telluria sp.]|nr:hypothetical protein [Telluria sp.]
MSEPVRWLMIEGIAALFGAGVLYLLVGVAFKVVGSTTPFAWREAVDSMGWLYGAMLIAIQSSARFFNAVEPSPLRAVGCIVATGVCCLLLIAAMYLRGATAGWTPPNSMKLVVGMFAIFILVLGYQARVEPQIDVPKAENRKVAKVSIEQNGGPHE